MDMKNDNTRAANQWRTNLVKSAQLVANAKKMESLIEDKFSRVRELLPESFKADDKQKQFEKNMIMVSLIKNLTTSDRIEMVSNNKAGNRVKSKRGTIKV